MNESKEVSIEFINSLLDFQALFKYSDSEEWHFEVRFPRVLCHLLHQFNIFSGEH